jgi:hypothetical protein
MELLDAKTMYNSGQQACGTGLVNKLFNSVFFLFDDNIEVKKGDFSFKGFQIDYDALLSASMILLKESGDIDILSKIAEGSFTPYVIQKIASKVYEILKETKQDDNGTWKFHEIVYYSSMGLGKNVFQDNNENIKQFCQELDYKILSSQTYGGIFVEGSLSKNIVGGLGSVQKDVQTLINPSEPKGNIALGNQDQMEIEKNPYLENQDMIMTEKTLLGDQSYDSDSSDYE